MFIGDPTSLGRCRFRSHGRAWKQTTFGQHNRTPASSYWQARMLWTILSGGCSGTTNARRERRDAFWARGTKF